jgi:hypothetical protein
LAGAKASAYPVDNLKNSVLLKEKLVDGRVLDDNKEIQFAADPIIRGNARTG